MPERPVAGVRVGLEDFGKVIGGKFVSFLARFLRKSDGDISRHDEVKRVNRAVDLSLFGEVRVCPAFCVGKIFGVMCPAIDAKIAQQKKRARVLPLPKRSGCGQTINPVSYT